MSAHPDLFREASGELVMSLETRAAWHSIRNPKDPEAFLPWVVESYCGRYTITWSVPAGAEADGKIFLLWRRHAEQAGRRPMPSMIGRYTSALDARKAAAEHAEGNP